jgi:RNA-directed DNA polymerase
MNTASQPMYEWKDLPWKDIERRVFKLQKRIYKASNRGDVKTVHKLQRLLMKSWSAKCLATRRVTQDNQGKKTAGIDGVKSLTPKERMELVVRLNLNLKAKPVRRVWIPKPGTTEKRGLGIPTMQDRALQALIKLVLEPEWEAKFEPNSYGFRPGRSCHDALVAIHNSINKRAKYVLDADIAKCFDRINHKALLDKMATFPALRRLVKGWLEAGIMEGETLFPSIEGTPQGGVCSPILANIALHGLETTLRKAVPETSIQNGKRVFDWKPIVCRYADDFVVLHPDLTVIEQCKDITNAWLTELGLELKESKTRISHTLHPHNGQVGFDFLGCTIRQYTVGNTHTGKWSNAYASRTLGYKTFIRPSKKALHTHLQEIKHIIRNNDASPQTLLIEKLNPNIKGWANYFSPVAAKRTFRKADYLVFHKLFRWARRRHPNKTLKWIADKYWTFNPRWNFTAPDGTKLFYHSDTPIQRHTKVKGTKSPFDGDWVYWATRLGQYPELLKSKAILLKKQKGRCVYCGLFFKHEDLLELDHTIPSSLDGQDKYKNWQLLHRHCHDRKTANDGSLAVRDTHDKSQVVEEPDEAKVSRPVLKTSRAGDCPA